MRGVYLPQHVLLTPAWYEDGWWRVNDTNCDPDVMETVLARSIAFLHFNFLDRNGTNNVTSSDGLVSVCVWSVCVECVCGVCVWSVCRCASEVYTT